MTSISLWSKASNWSHPQIFSAVCVAATGFLGLLVMSGWWAGIPLLKSVSTGWVAMKFNAALCFSLSAIALGLQIREPVSQPLRKLAQVSAWLVAVMGFLTLLEFLVPVDLKIDEAFWEAGEPEITDGYPGRMAELSALCFLLIGSVLATLDARRLARRFGPWLAFLVTWLGLLGVIGANWDITDQRQAQEALRASEQLLRDFVRHAPAAIAMLDTELCYLQASDQWSADFHIPISEAIGRCHYELFPDLPQRWKDIHQRVLAGAIERCDDDPFPRPDGSMDWLQWEARPWRDPQGEIGGLLLFTQVITVRKQLEVQLEKHKQELERSNQDLAQFAYVASHDLQEPLRAVSGCAQILKRRYSDQIDLGADELIRHIVEGAERMQTLIRDLLTYSRVGRGNLTLVDVGEVVEEVLLLLQTPISENGASITVDPLPKVRAAKPQIKQLFQNLIANALKYRSSSEPQIHISAVFSDEQLEFTISDNGIGIDPQYHSKIFHLFQRLHTREEHPGTGIGLSLCQRIVQQHGGEIWVESQFGLGSTFHFTLPKGDFLDDEHE